MGLQKIIIVFESYHHYKSEKIARVFAQGLQAECFKPDQVNLSKLSDFDMLVIGSGIYFSKPHEKIQKYLAQFPTLEGKKPFSLLPAVFKKGIILNISERNRFERIAVN